MLKMTKPVEFVDLLRKHWWASFNFVSFLSDALFSENFTLLCCIYIRCNFSSLWFNGTALNDALTTEVQRLKLATAELGGEHPSKCMVSQLSVNHQMFQLQQQQHSNQINIHQLQQQQQQQQHQQQSQQQNGSTTSKPESMQ